MDTDLPAIKYLLAAREWPTPHVRLYVIPWYTGTVSILAAHWEEFCGWWGPGKIDSEPFKQRTKRAPQPVYAAVEVAKLLREWQWEQHRLTQSVEFQQPLAEAGFADEAGYLEWLRTQV